MSTIERFWFVDPNLRLRTSTVQRFGGFNTATFCAEMRTKADAEGDQTSETVQSPNAFHSITGW